MASKITIASFVNAAHAELDQMLNRNSPQNNTQGQARIQANKKGLNYTTIR